MTETPSIEERNAEFAQRVVSETPFSVQQRSGKTHVIFEDLEFTDKFTTFKPYGIGQHFGFVAFGGEFEDGKFKQKFIPIDNFDIDIYAGDTKLREAIDHARNNWEKET